MNLNTFEAVIADIEKNLELGSAGPEGRGYELEVQLTTGVLYRGTWSKLKPNAHYSAIVMSPVGDYPPVYVAIEHIMTITLARS
jgi:hypothetical protein